LIKDWLTGNNTYHTLIHCMGHDSPWIILYIISNLMVFFPYCFLAKDFLDSFLQNNKGIKKFSKPDIASFGMSLIFVLCAFLGYAFDLVRIWFPAYRLIAIFKILLGILSFVTLYYVNKIQFFNRYHKLERENQKFLEESIKLEIEFLENKAKIRRLEEIIAKNE